MGDCLRDLVLLEPGRPELTFVKNILELIKPFPLKRLETIELLFIKKVVRVRR
jgi:hypothetical protein